jgi:hypothetical protein
MIYPLDFYTQYHQLFICDKNSSKETDEQTFWTEEASKSRLAVGDGILGASLECYGPFKGELVILDKKKDEIEYDEYDHVVEGGLEITSGVLQVLDCPNFSVELEIKLSNGIYRVRIYSSNLISVVGDSGDDYYRIEIWPDSDMQRKVLKQYKSY